MTALLGLPRVSVLGQPLAAWVEGGAIFLALLLAVLVARRFLLSHGARLQARAPGEVGNVVAALALGSAALTLPAGGERALRSAAVLAFLLQVAIWASAGIDAWVTGYRR